MRALIGFFTIVLLFLLVLPKTGYSQDWNDTQKEIWKNVQTYWMLDDQKNVDGFSQYFDDSYKGWSYDSDKPMNKMQVVESIKKEYDSEKDVTMKTSLTPLDISVNGNMAFVHYTYATTVTSEDGTAHHRSGRWTDILMKKGDKWVLIGDHGGRLKQD